MFTYMMEGVINMKNKWISSFILGYIILFIFAPFYNGDKIDLNTLHPYTSKYYWLIILGCDLVGLLVAYKFTKRKPRKYYGLQNETTIIPLISVLITCLVFILIPIAIINNLFIKIILVVIDIAVIYFLGYIMYSKAIIIYEDNTIILYNFKRKIYKNSKIDNLKVDEKDNKYIINIIINNEEHIIYVSYKIANKVVNKIKRDFNI